MVVIEGPDAAGKSTLAMYIEQQYKEQQAEIVHLGRPPAYVRHWDILRMAVYHNANNTIYDRMCIGSMVYGPIMQDRYNIAPVTEVELYKWADMMEATHSFLIIAHCDMDELKLRLGLRGDTYIDAERLEKIHERYDFVVEKLINYGRPHNMTVYDSANESPLEFISKWDFVIRRALEPTQLSADQRMEILNKDLELTSSG